MNAEADLPESTPPEPGKVPAPEVDPAEVTTPRFPVVGIGASAGGLEAVGSFLRRIRHDSMGFVLVQHLAPGQEAVLKDLLAKLSPIEVIVAKDGMEVVSNKLFVAPSSVDLAIERGHLVVKQPSKAHPRHAIDAFFRSLAAHHHSAAIGIVLSGAGSDGTLGLQAIKDEGGITFVQDPSTAVQSSMPQSALDSGYADFCMTAEEIGDELMRLSAHPYVARTRTAALVDRESLAKIFSPLRDVYGVDFNAYKQSSIERRIARRMALHKVDTLEEYSRFLDKNSLELNQLYHDLLIGVTSFFRDKDPYEALKTIVFPRLVENRDPETPLRIWVPGCSTGEEAYSIAMALLEYPGDRALRHRVQIFGTDVDEQSLERARVGIYPQNIEMDVSAPRLQRFFARAEKGYQISRQIREMVVFARHNLAKDPPFSRLDLIACRNVLIYFQTPLQRKIIRIFHYGLNPAGFLLLGTSESVAEGSDLFQLVDRRLKLYLKRNIAASAVFDMAFGGTTTPETGERRRERGDGRTSLTAQQLADRKVIEKYGPPGCVVNENLDILQFRGRTGPFLEPAPGNATLNLLKLARPEFLLELRSTIKKALAEALPVSSEVVRIKDSAGSTMAVQLDVLPLYDAASTTKSLLVLFNERPRGDAPEPSSSSTPAGEPANPRVQELEREITTTKEYLQTTIEELETTNEELMSANEELQSSNEELQSTNEELSTSKEELQSTNEELSTVNEELHHRLTELSVSNDDLQNLLASPTIVVVLVGADLRLRRFSQAAAKLLHLIPADVGRPVSYLASAIKVHDIDSTINEMTATMTVRTVRARASDGNEYDLRISPYKTADQAVRGAVLELINRKPSKTRAPGEIHGLAEPLLGALPRPVLVLDEDLRVAWANASFFSSFVLDGRIYGRDLADVWGRPLEEPLRQWLEDLGARRATASERAVTDPFTRQGSRRMRWVASTIARGDEHPALVVLLMEEQAR